MADIREKMRLLEVNIDKDKLSEAAKLEALIFIKSKIISSDAAASFDQDDIQILYHYAFERSAACAESSIVALKCLANLLLLNIQARQVFVDNDYPIATARGLKGGSEEQLLCSRILFLLTYKETKFNFETLFKEESLANRVHEAISSHAMRYAEHGHEISRPDLYKVTGSPSNPDLPALTETLKLLFNLIYFYPNHVEDFDRTIASVLQILRNIHLEAKPLQPPVVRLVNVLLNLNLPGPVSVDSIGSRPYTPLFPRNAAENTYPRLISILDMGVRSYQDEELDALVPLVTLLRRIFELAPPDVRSDMQTRLLPSSEERTQPLGKTDSLSSRLLRLSTAPTAPMLKEGISSFLFELSDKDAATFVRNVGYGFAAGYLMTHNLPVPDQSSGDAGERVTSIDGQEINPVTGQRRDMEPQDPLPEMTDEEKEREAEKLFVLFERLKATGVMNVVNPVEQAAREGRFEEVD